MEDNDANVIDFNAQRAAASLRAAPEGDPKKASRAYRLAQSMRLPAEMVLQDMESTEDDYHASLGTDLVNGNPQLAKYLNSHPLAPTISKNDLGNLDSTSEKLNAWYNDKQKSANASWGDKIQGAALMANIGIESAVGTIASGIGYMTGATGFQGADKRMLASTEAGLKKQLGDEEYKRVRGGVEGTLFGDVSQGAGSMVPMLAAGIFGGTLPGALTMGVMNAEELRRRAEEKGGNQLAAFTAGGAIGTAFGFVPMHLLNKPIQAAGPGMLYWTGAKLQQAGVMGTTFALMGEAQHDFNEWAARLLFDPNAMYHPDSRRFVTSFFLGGLLGGGFGKVEPYVKADKPIPPGIDPAVDQIKGWEAQHDLEKLKELEKETAKDETKALDPDFYHEKFLNQHGDGTVRIDIEGIKALYGDKTPTPDDGILGHVIPNLDIALQVAMETGGHVEVKLNDWLAKVEPEVANALHDDMVLREGGVSINEHKANEEYQQKIEEAAAKVKEAEAAKEAQPPREGEVVSDVTEEPVRPGQQEARLRAAPRPRAEPPAERLPGQGEDVSLAEKPKEEAPKGWEKIEGRTPSEILPIGEDIFHYETEPGVWVALRPRNVYSKYERDIVNLIEQAIEQFIGMDKGGKKRVRAEDTFGIVSEVHGETTGLFRIRPGSQDYIPLLIYSLRGKDPYGTFRHEAIHFLLRKGFFDEAEWKIMTDAAEANGWIKKHKIDERYADHSYEIQLEEAIADEFRIWGRDRYMSHPAVGPFEKLRALLAHIRAHLYKLTELKEVTVDDLFARIETGEIKLREPQDPKSEFMQRVNAARREGGLMEETLYSRDGSPFEPKALGITKKESSKLLRLWNRQVKADQQASMEAEAKKVMRNRSPEWKARRKSMREDVEDEVKNRPDFMVDEFMRENNVKFDRDMLSDVQKEFLPKELYGKDGIDPDRVASTFGYHSGEAMINRLGALINKRKNTPPKEFLKNEVDRITDQRMEKEYGTPEKEAMDAAQDHALGETTLDLVHEQTISMGSTKPEVAIQITKKMVKDYVKDMFDKIPMSMAKASDFLAQAKRAEQRIRMALMSKDEALAYREHQAKEYAVIAAKYANDLKKVMDRVERIRKRFAVREVENADPEVVAFIQQLLDRFDMNLRREAYDYNDRIAMFQESGAPKYRDFREFVQKQWEGDKDPPISDLLYNPNFKGPIENLTTEQFQELAGSLSALQKKAVDAYTVEVQGEKKQLYDVVSEMEGVFSQKFKGKEHRIDIEPSHIVKTAKWFWANHVTWESIFNRLDSNNIYGLFNQSLGLPLIRGANAAQRLWLEAGQKFKALTPAREMNKFVENPWFRRPKRVDENNKIVYGDFLQMDRGNILTVLQYMGHPEGWFGLLDGYGIPRAKSGDVMDWVWKHVTEEDVIRAKQMGNIFDWAFDKGAATAAADTGYPPVRVKKWRVSTPWGDFDGWYHRIAYDKNMAQSIKALVDPSMLIERQYNRATPSNNWSKTRTGASGPYLLSLDMAPHYVNEILYDSALRLPLKEASKIMGHTNFKLAMSKYMGPHFTRLIEPFLKDVAGAGKYDADEHHIGVQTWRFIRTNMITHYVGINVSTWVKHNFTALGQSMMENGSAKYWKEVISDMTANAPTGESWNKFAMQMSDQLAPRHTNWIDTMSGAYAHVYGNMRLGMTAKDFAASFEDRPFSEGIKFAGKQLGGAYLSYRQGLMWYEAAPLAAADLWTAQTTWLVAYKQELARTGNLDQAIDYGDRAVRRSHGATTITNRPGFMRGGEFARSMTAFYTVFNHFLQRNYEFAWAVKELSSGGKYYVRPDKILDWKGVGTMAGYKLGMAAIPVFSAYFVSYFLWPAFVEMLAGGFEKEKNTSYPVAYLESLARTTLGGILGVRDFASALLHGADPTVGLYGELYKSGHRFVTKTIHGKWNNREQQQAYVRDTYTLFNMLGGALPANAALRAGMFTKNWLENRERVNTLGDVWWGVTKGTTQPHRRH